MALDERSSTLHNRINEGTSQHPNASLIRRAAADQVWAQNRSLELSQRYPNRWIAIHDQRVVAVDLDHARCMQLAQACCEMPITFVHTCAPRVPGTNEGVVSGNLDDLPADIRSGSQSVDAETIGRELRDLRYRSVSFDLHGTLVLSRIGWNERIATAFRRVLAAHGFHDVVVRLERIHGPHTAAIIAGVAKFWYDCCAASEEGLIERGEVLPFPPWNPTVRWSLANSYAIAALIADDDERTATDDARAYDEVFFARLRERTWRRPHRKRSSERRRAREEFPGLAAADLPRAVEELRLTDEWRDMGIAVHEQISGSAPADWYATDEQRAIVRSAIDRGLVTCVLSNGSVDAVRACVAQHFPDIPPWQVFTPTTFSGAGKPGPANAAQLLASIGSAMVRNAIEDRSAPPAVAAAIASHRRRRDALRRRWGSASAELYRRVADGARLRNGAGFSTALREALGWFARALGLPEAAVGEMTMHAHEHLHVGNSKYHDALPLLGLGLPFRCIRYDPSDVPQPKPLVRLQRAGDLRPTPHFDDRGAGHDRR